MDMFETDIFEAVRFQNVQSVVQNTQLVFFNYVFGIWKSVKMYFHILTGLLIDVISTQLTAVFYKTPIEVGMFNYKSMIYLKRKPFEKI